MVEAFHKNGFIHIPSFFTSNELDEISAATENLKETHPHEGYYEPSVLNQTTEILVRMEKILSWSPDLVTVFSSKKVKALLENCLQDEPVLFKDKVNFKAPGNRADLLHQDQQAGWSEYAPYFVSLCVCVDPNTSLNGCLQLPNVQSYRHHKKIYGNTENPLEITDVPGLQLLEYPAEAGDVFVFDSYVPHASNPNYSEAERRNIYLTYNRKSDGNHHSQYYEDKYQTYPPNAMRLAGTSYKYKV